MLSGKLKAFSQLGYIEQDAKHSSQSKGKCPFCYKDMHFYINKKTFAWDCKKCGRSGGFNTFLKCITDFACKNFKGNFAIDLHKKRKIKIVTLRKHKVGYLPSKNIYTIPVLNEEGMEIVNIRQGKLGKKLMGLSGCPVCLYNWDKLLNNNNKKGNVWLCEGHWDALAISELINNDKDVYIASPGADIFKSVWVNLLQDRKVNVLYDNDDAGDRGSVKVYNFLKSITKELKFVNWPAYCKDGYDISDFNTEKKTIIDLQKLLKNHPRNVDIVEPIASTDNLFNGEGIDYKEVYKVYKKRLELENTDILDIVFGTVIANRLPAEPVWIYLISPPGGVKSEIIMSLSDAQGIFPLSALSPHTLVSGYGNQSSDPSYLPKFNNKVVALNDMSNVLSMPDTIQSEIYGILRLSFDGEYSRPFGNNLIRVYKNLKYGIIAGMTPAIEQYFGIHAALGERFISYVIPLDNSMNGRINYSRKAMDNILIKKTMREELKDVANKVLEYNYKIIPSVSSNIEKKILYISQLISMGRGTVPRDKYSKEVTYKPFSEIGTRPTIQLTELILGIGMFKHLKKIGNDEYTTIKHIATSSIPNSVGCVIKEMHDFGKTKEVTTGEIANMVNLPRVTTGRLLENLYMLKVLRRTQPMVGKFKWGFTDDMLEIIEGSEIYE